MTKKELLLSIITGIFIGSIFSACFIGGVQHGLDCRDEAMGIDSKAIIQEVVR